MTHIHESTRSVVREHHMRFDRTGYRDRSRSTG